MSYYIPSRTYSRFSPIYYTPVTPPTPPAEYVPFTVKVLNAGTNVGIIQHGSPNTVTLYYSVDDGDWTPYTVGDYIYPNDHVAFSGSTETFSRNGGTYRLNVGSDYIVSGHLNSLINKKEDVPAYGFWSFFQNSENSNDANPYLLDATDLILPSGTTNTRAYERLFYRCTNLSSGPELPATSFVDGEYYRNMFAECHSLVHAGPIRAKRMVWASGEYMFYNCSSLVIPPEFNPDKIEPYGMKQMFHYCSSLSSLPQGFNPKIIETNGLESAFRNTGIRELNINWSALSSVGNSSCVKAFANCNSLTSVIGSIGTSDMTFTDNNAFQELFYQCYNLVDASNFTMNPMNISYNYSYTRLFRQCTSLTGAPNLPATGFIGTHSYNTMFYGCTSLKDGPYLPATQGGNCSYRQMFNGCTSLTGIHVELTSWLDPNNNIICDTWVNNVAADGTFIKPAALSEEYSSSRIPNGWTVIDQ